ncbi:MAG: hypothetical protein HZB40_05290 [Rhodocyclales bacterium]|nr:hypothetical protein [Rhodocyclales bacterium]
MANSSVLWGLASGVVFVFAIVFLRFGVPKLVNAWRKLSKDANSLLASPASKPAKVIEASPLKTLDANGQVATTIRRERPELYELLRDPNVIGLYFDKESTSMARTWNASMVSALPPSDRKAEFQRFISFMVDEGRPFFEEWLWDCGSAIDNLVGELSLTFTKPESEELVKHLQNPTVARFLKFPARGNSMRMSKEISENFSGPAYLNASKRLAIKCRNAGFEEGMCSRLEINRSIALPSSNASAAQPIIPPDAAR